MRAGGCTVQQTLTAEAAGVVKHAVALARQRGHAQVTPLHVAATLLAPGAMSLLRRACLKSHPNSTSHPLQCRALELCFKVALNRLPTAAGPMMLSGQPSLSNALVAALKRAQAHQRRGCLEQQHQPLLAVKVEMEQLIISILDDPSVSRVMREAGFSSTFVKNNLEDETSNFPSSLQNCIDLSVSVSRSAAKIKGLMAEAVETGCGVLYTGINSNLYGFDNNGRSNFFKSHRSSGSLKSEDVENVFEVLIGKKTRKTNSVIVGDCFLTTENVIREVMNRIERGDVPDLLRGVQFITPHFSTLILSRPEQVEQKLAELRRRVNDCLVGGSAIIYAGDLRWAVDINNNNNHNKNSMNNYCPVEHICMELGRMLGSHAESRRVWLMATASFETYMRCQKRKPSLETLWGLQAVPVPFGGLTLTLQASSTITQVESKTNGVRSDLSAPVSHNIMRSVPPLKTVNPDDELVDKLNCCSECATNFEAEADSLQAQEQKMVSSDEKLPFWLQQCRNNTEFDASAQVKAKLRELRKKWNQKCRSNHSHFFDRVQLQRSALEFPHHPASMVSSANPSPPWWCSTQSHAWSALSASLPSNTSTWSNQLSGSTPEKVGDSSNERTASMDDSPRFNVKTTLALGLAATDDNGAECTASRQLPTVSSDGAKNQKQFDPESLKELTELLAEKVPWQSEGNVRAIASAVLHCRSGTARRENSVKGDTWLLALGPDRMGKRKMAQALAEVFFGSQDKFLCLGRVCSRERNIESMFRGKTYLDRLTHAIGLNPHCVVLLEEIEQADAVFMGAIVKAMERGNLMDSNGREVSLSDTIVFMTSNLGTKHFTSVKGVQFDEEKLSKALGATSWGLKLVVQEQPEKKSGQQPCKRKAEWNPMKNKETEKRKTISPALDLNVDANEQALGAAGHIPNQEAGSISGNSDVTQDSEVQTGAQSDQIFCCARDSFSPQFFKSLDKCVVFQAFDFDQLAECLLEKLHDSFGRATNGRGSLQVESLVVERMVSCCWELAPSGRRTFEKWVEEIFEVGLGQMLSKHTITAKTVVKLSAAPSNRDCFYANTSLPTRLEIDPGSQS